MVHSGAECWAKTEVVVANPEGVCRRGDQVAEGPHTAPRVASIFKLFFKCGIKQSCPHGLQHARSWRSAMDLMPCCTAFPPALGQSRAHPGGMYSDRGP